MATSLEKGVIRVTLTDAEKLTVKSSNVNVVKTGKAEDREGILEIPYEVKAAGTAKITLTANDGAKTSRELLLCVKDTEPVVSTTAVKVNSLSAEGTAFSLYAGQDAPIREVTLEGNGQENFLLNYNGEDGSCRMTARDESVTGRYTGLKLHVVFEDESLPAWETSLSVTAEKKTPAFKIGQKEKVNLFYTPEKGKAELSITTGEEIEEITLESENFEIIKEEETYYVKARQEDLAANCSKSGKIKIRFKDYRGFGEVNFNTKVQKKAPVMTLGSKNIAFYPSLGIDSAAVSVLCSGSPYELSADHIRLEGTKDYSCTAEKGEAVITCVNGEAKEKTKASLVLHDEEWTEEIKIPVTLTINKKQPKVQLSRTTLQLNGNQGVAGFDGAVVRVTWKDGAMFAPDKLTISAANEASQKVLGKVLFFETDKEEGKVKVRLNNTGTDKGTYKYKIHVTQNGRVFTQSLTVKVVPAEMEKVLKVTARGSIDVLNRTGSRAVLTPTLKGINAKVIKAEIMGEYGRLFEDPVVEDGKILLSAREGASLITKYDYRIRLKLTLENEWQETLEVTAPEVKIRCKQGKAKITAEPLKGECYSHTYNTVEVRPSAVLKGAEDPVITEVELMNMKEAFTAAYDTAEGVLRITLKETGEAAKGKTYTLQFRVGLAGQADNEKDVILKYKVAVK